MRYAAICDLKDVEEYDFRVIADWLKTNPLNENVEARPWQNSQFKDLKDVSGGRELDPLSSFLALTVVPGLYQLGLHKFKVSISSP